MVKQSVVLLLLVLGLAIAAGAGGGFVASRLFEPNANAKENSPPQVTREIIVPPEGLTFRTTDGKIIATVGQIEGPVGKRNTLVIFNQAGKRAIALNASFQGGDVSVYDNREGGAAVSIFATSSGSGQLSIMGDLKPGLQLSAGKDGGLITVNESEGFPAMTLGTKSHRGSIQVLDGSEGKVIWSAPPSN